MDWQTHKQQLLKNPKFKQALKDSELEFKIAKMAIEARIKKGLTQKELAQKLNTRQSVISRLENSKTTPSLSFLKKLAIATGATLTISFQ